MFSRSNPWQLILPISLFLASPVFAQPADTGASDAPAAPVEQEQPEIPSLQEGDPDQRGTTPAIEPTPLIEESPTSVEVPSPTASNDFATEEQDQQEEPVKDGESKPSPLFAEPKIARGKTPDLTVRGNTTDGFLDRWNVTMGGYLRTAYTWIDNDPNLQAVGRNDGFNFADARLSFAGEMDNGLGFFFELNGATNIGADPDNAPAHKIGVRLSDAYALYRPFSFLEFNLGQFKAPFDREELISNSAMLFVNRSVGNRGVTPIEGRYADGLGITREMGLQARGHYYFLAEDDKQTGPGVSYALAITNGQPENLTVNGNGKMAYYGRAAIHWGEAINLGGAYFINNNTFGIEPNRISQDLSGWTADLLINMYGASLFANVIQRQATSPDLANSPTIQSFSYQVQVAYQEPFFGLQPAYRLSYLDPTSDFDASTGAGLELFEQDALLYHTIGLNYNATGYPVRVMANYTFTGEQEQRELDNDRFDILLQLTW